MIDCGCHAISFELSTHLLKRSVVFLFSKVPQWSSIWKQASQQAAEFLNYYPISEKEAAFWKFED
jgi:hypothetical protein